MRKHLSKLYALEELALSRDTYDIGIPEDPVYRYYDYHFLPPREFPNDVNDNGNVWEKKQRAQILNEAEPCVDIMANPKWLYLGKISTRVVKSQDTGDRVARPVSGATQVRDVTQD